MTQNAVSLEQLFARDLGAVKEYCRHLGGGKLLTSSDNEGLGNCQGNGNSNAEAHGKEEVNTWTNTSLATSNTSELKAYEAPLSLCQEATEAAVFKRVKVLDLKLKPESLIYMEGYQMLSQTTGTVANPVPIGRINEVRDYRLYEGNSQGTWGSNFFMVKEDGFWCLIGATSAEKTDLEFLLKDNELSVFWDLEGTRIEAGSDYARDYVAFIKGTERSEVLAFYADLIGSHHLLRPSQRKTGWCSWYCYYADITEALVRENLDCMVQNFTDASDLEYVQIDDGYQAHMGDWLIESQKFESGLKKLCADILARGRKPAIWLAPFIAEGESEIFKKHPTWFIKDEDGNFVEAGNVTYGGWRCTPWYLLDMTNNEVRHRIRHVFEVMRRDYGIDYFKLDACYWGAIRGLKYSHDITAVTHYRLGLAAIRQGAGDDAYILGCNAPFWPSLGLVDAQRVTDDVERTPERIAQISREFRYRAWMGGKLWQNDVDCLVTAPLEGGSELLSGYFRILLAMALCAGGPVLIGDDLRRISYSHSLKDLRGSGAELTVMDALKHRTLKPAIFTGDNADHALLELTNGERWALTFKDDDVLAEKLS